MTFKKALATTLLTAALSLPITFIDTQPAFAASSDTKSSEARPKAKPAKAANAKSGKKDFRQVGTASWYGPGFQGRRTANGERFDQNALTAAHRTLPFGTRVRVTNLNNERSVVVRINDRGPFVRGRVIDVSRAAAVRLDMLRAGVVPVRVEALD